LDKNELVPLLGRVELRVAYVHVVEVAIFVAKALSGLVRVFECIEDGEHASMVLDFNSPVVQAEIAEPILLHVWKCTSFSDIISAGSI
jgi:hypothetical protein